MATDIANRYQGGMSGNRISAQARYHESIRQVDSRRANIPNFDDGIKSVIEIARRSEDDAYLSKDISGKADQQLGLQSKFIERNITSHFKEHGTVKTKEFRHSKNVNGLYAAYTRALKLERTHNTPVKTPLNGSTEEDFIANAVATVRSAKHNINKQAVLFGLLHIDIEKYNGQLSNKIWPHLTDDDKKFVGEMIYAGHENEGWGNLKTTVEDSFGSTFTSKSTSKAFISAMDGHVEEARQCGDTPGPLARITSNDSPEFELNSITEREFSVRGGSCTRRSLSAEPLNESIFNRGVTEKRVSSSRNLESTFNEATGTIITPYKEDDNSATLTNISTLDVSVFQTVSSHRSVEILEEAMNANNVRYDSNQTKALKTALLKMGKLLGHELHDTSLSMSRREDGEIVYGGEDPFKKLTEFLAEMDSQIINYRHEITGQKRQLETQKELLNVRGVAEASKMVESLVADAQTKELAELPVFIELKEYSESLEEYTKALEKIVSKKKEEEETMNRQLVSAAGQLQVLAPKK